MASDPNWQRDLYEAQAAGLVLYGRALGLGRGEAEDVLQETFVALLKLDHAPENPPHYGLRAFGNAALNYRRGLWRRLTRELKSRRPSAKLEARIFGGTPADAPASTFGSWRLEFRHGAVVAAACVARLMAVSPGGNWMTRLTAAGGEFPGLAAWSNQSSGAALTLAFAPHNHWSAPILSWTNEGHIPSNTRSFESVNTNRLLH